MLTCNRSHGAASAQLQGIEGKRCFKEMVQLCRAKKKSRLSQFYREPLVKSIIVKEIILVLLKKYHISKKQQPYFSNPERPVQDY